MFQMSALSNSTMAPGPILRLSWCGGNRDEGRNGGSDLQRPQRDRKSPRGQKIQQAEILKDDPLGEPQTQQVEDSVDI
jgi:hypothetical protein